MDPHVSPRPWPKGVSGLCYGGDYNPEQWPGSVWREDVELMRQAGVNLVTVGVFSWATLEPEPGRYTFDWLDEVLDLLADAGIGVNLATPTASPPPWFSVTHPDGLPVTADGVRLTHGSRDTYCAAAPAYRQAVGRIVGELADRYAGHPSLAMWHVHNEYGTTCYCDHAAVAFRRWLAERYDGSLDALNEAWGTAFWSQRYSAWEQIQPPRATQYLPNPHQVLDFRRFWSDELLAAYCAQRDILRAATPDVPVTTNFVFGAWVPVDHRRWAAEVDLVAVDCYPRGGGAEAAEHTAFLADLARSWSGGRPWLLMEQSPATIADRGVAVPKAPGQMARLSMSSVARGSRGAMFFQWRASSAGAEQYHSAMVPHAGPQSRIFAEVTELGAALGRLGDVDDSVVEADVAITWDVESWWALGQPHLPSPRLDYLRSVRRAHRSVVRAGLTADFVHLTDDLSRYRLVLVPSHYLVSDAAAASVRRYVSAGGHLAVWYFSGVADQHGRVRLGGYPGGFREVLGVHVEEVHPLPDGVTTSLASGGSMSVWSEDVALAGAETVARYAGGVLAERPAITQHQLDDGLAWYVSGELDDDSYASLVDTMIAAAGVAPAGATSAGTAGRRAAGLPRVPPGVEVIRRRSGSARWMIVLNHNGDAVAVPASGVDVVTGAAVDRQVTVPAGGWVVLRTDEHEDR